MAKTLIPSIVKECTICGNPTNLQQHHIIPLSKGGEDSVFNKTYVCIRHHVGIHGHGVGCPISNTEEQLEAILFPKTKCLNCRHEWAPQVENPKKCPKCGVSNRYGYFSDYNPIMPLRRIMPELQCSNCGHKWTPRVKNPKKCPYCGISGRYGNFKIINEEEET